MAIASAINFGSLIGAQLTALIEAEVEGAEKTSEYIEEVGFEKQSNGTLKLRMVHFEMKRRDVDGKIRKHNISVPVLNLVPIPMLTIEEANLSFDLHVEGIVNTEPKKLTPSRSTTSRRIRNTLLMYPVQSKKPMKLVTRLAKTSYQDSKVTSDIKLKIKIAQSPFPIGIEKLINIADLSIEDETNE